jgi:hypothetical protein
MHPTQHSTVKRPEPRILRTHRLITRGVAEDKADAFVAAAVESLQSLGSKPAKPLQLAPPAKRSLQELLSQASEEAKAFTPRKATFNTEAA